MKAGRRRKTGRRKPSGDLVLDPKLRPAAIAATMPHRCALGEKAVDQRRARAGAGDRRGGLCARHWRGERASLFAGSICRARGCANSGWKMGAVRMMRTSSLSMFRPIAVGILGSEFEQRRLVAELYLLPGLIHMHDLVDDLEQRLVVVNLAVMHFLWLAPAAIK